uniref:Uncharacterized protein n=1 Tax=viral metagenome TaxID=1070528 RepID=A0A6C0HZ18_9ZZZZ
MSIHTKYKIVVLDSNNEPKETILFSKEGDNEEKIHPDDTIQIIKKKFLKEYMKIKPISYEEIYMFSHISKEVLTESFFNSISNSGKYINSDILNQVLSNLDIDLEIDPNKDKYSYEDFFNLMGNKNTLDLEYKISLDRKFQSKTEEYFSANPFDIISGSANIFTDKANNPIITLDNQVLLTNNSAKFIDDTIYVCLAEDVLNYCCEENGWDDYSILKMYYSRMITTYEINSQEDFMQNRQKMITETGKMINEYTFQMTKIVDLFYNIHENASTNIEYTQRGIKEISIRIVPTVAIGLPLESIFKKIHATKTTPFIKFNPGFRRENIYRIYCDKLSKKGEKVPYMKKNLILRLAKELGRKKIISFYTYDTDYEIYVDLESNGNVKIRGFWYKEAVNIENINKQFSEKANPIISNINNLLSSSGHSIALLESLNQNNINIEEVTYFWETRVNPNSIILNKLVNCLVPIFEIYDIDAKIEGDEGVELRFKRVDNYRNMDAKEIFINEIFKKTEDLDKIKDLLIEKFRLSEEEAIQQIVDFTKYNKGNDISDSPGFPIFMKIDNFNGAIFKAQVTISKNIEYIDILNMYIEGILRITQNKTQKHLLKEISNLCLSKKKNTKREPKEQQVNVIKNREAVEDIKTSPIRNLLEEQFGISEGSIEFEEDEKEPSLGSMEFEEGEEFEEEQAKEKENSFGSMEFEEDEEEPAKKKEDSFGSMEFEEDEEKEGGKLIIDEFPNNEDFNNIGYYFKGGENSDEEDAEDEEEDTNEIYNEKDLIGKNIGSQLGVLRRLQEKDPVLFNYRHSGVKKGKYTIYSRACQSTLQPMVLTDEEKNKLDKTNPDSYENALRYGSDPKKQFWYMCPRFWCLKTNMPISEKDAKSGKCGKILPKNAENILPGHYVYEFDRDGKNTPAFFKDNDRHPDGYCLPCCFKKSWNNPEFANRRAECKVVDEANAQEEAEEGEEKLDEKQTKKQKLQLKTNENYIRNIDKFPLEPQRWGFLPISIQKMLQIKNNMSNSRLEYNKNTMLRYGIERSDNKSFIGCIADVYASEKKLKIPSIQEMCDILANAISIDTFLQAHNGSLPSMFQPKQYDYSEIDYRKYDSSKFIQSINKEYDSQEEFINDTIAAYENFQQFLRTEESIIDYTYLWDIVSMPNTLLFQRGINLAILQIPDNDATEHVDVVCPTSAYSSSIYDTRKNTLILTKRDNESNEEIAYFEPIYLYDKKQIIRTFPANTQIKPIQHILQVIRSFSQKKCAPLKSMPREYTFERNKPAKEIREICTKYNIDLLAQVLNFQGKIVAFLVNRPTGNNIYLPCAPSAMMPDIESIKYIDDETLWQKYIVTRDELLQLRKLTEGKLLCKPVIKIIEDELIVGMLTETNQFIMVNPPEENIIDDGLIELKDINYIAADINLANGRKMDNVRERTVKMIRLEKYFYQVFRTTLRILLHESMNEKTNLTKEIENLTYKNYYEQLEKVKGLLHEIMDNYVEFQIYDESTLMSLNEISDCFSGEIDKKPYCIFKSDVRKLRLPQRNLISGKLNSRVYFARLADELLRYKRIRSTIFDKRAYVSKTDEYQLNIDEIILLEYMMADYFENDLHPAMKIKDARISYEFANPYKTKKYSNEVKLIDQGKIIIENLEPIEEEKEGDEVAAKKDSAFKKASPKVSEEAELKQNKEYEDKIKLECVKEIKAVTGNASNIWKQYFPKKTRELILNPLIDCTYYPIMIIYKEVNDGKIITIEKIKLKLIEIYNKYSKYEEKILNLLSLQGKYDIMQKIAKKETTLEQSIMSLYPLSNLDYWILCENFNLPVILFTSMKNIKNLINNVSWLRLGENRNFKKREYYFVRAPTEKDSKRGTKQIHGYSMITPGIKFEDMPDFQEVYSNASIDESDNLINFETYLSGDFL